MVRASACFALALAFAAPLSAHHGVGTFELGKSVTFAGTLTKIEFINPHSWLYFEVKEADGKVVQAPLRDALRARAAAIRLDQGAVPGRSADHRGGGAGPSRSGLVLPEHDSLRQRQPHGPLRAVRARARGRRQGGPRQAADGGQDARAAPAERRAQHQRRLGARAGGDGRSTGRRRRPGAAQHHRQGQAGRARAAARGGAAVRRPGRGCTAAPS